MYIKIEKKDYKKLSYSANIIMQLIVLHSLALRRTLGFYYEM